MLLLSTIVVFFASVVLFCMVVTQLYRGESNKIGRRAEEVSLVCIYYLLLIKYKSESELIAFDLLKLNMYYPLHYNPKQMQTLF